jgi:putative RecB family exonuclease
MTPPPPRHPASLSPTALRAWDTCPRQYRFAYLERPEVEDPPSAHLIFGNALHKALAFLFRLPPAKRNVEVAHQALRHFWAREDGRCGAFLTETEEADWGLEALEALSLFCRERADELEVRPGAIEEWVRTSLPNGFAVGGKVDRAEKVTTLSAGEEITGLRITDYKTGKCHVDSGEELAEDRGAQVYALAASRAFRIPVIEVRFLFLRENRAVTWAVESDDLIEVEQRLAAQVEEIRAEREFVARPEFHCRWCRYRPLCPAGSGEASLDELSETPAVTF